MSKPVLGILLGAILGALDGLTALFYPEVASQIIGIVLGSTFKGIVAGVIMGFVARKYNNLPLGIIVGTLVGLTLAFIIAAMPDEKGNHYWLEIMVPGSLVGLILGYATQRYGKMPAKSAMATR